MLIIQPAGRKHSSAHSPRLGVCIVIGSNNCFVFIILFIESLCILDSYRNNGDFLWIVVATIINIFRQKSYENMNIPLYVLCYYLYVDSIRLFFM